MQAAAEICAAFVIVFAAPLETADIVALREDGRLAAFAPLSSQAAWQRACEALAGLGDPVKATSDLNAAFCRLFLGAGGPHGNAPPYESAYLGTGRLFQKPAAEMAELLATHGLNVADSEAPDHLAIELALLEALLAGPAVDLAAATALRRRLLGWVPRFAARCVACDAIGFYAAMAALLYAFLLDQPATRFTPLKPCRREIPA